MLRLAVCRQKCRCQLLCTLRKVDPLPLPLPKGWTHPHRNYWIYSLRVLASHVTGLAYHSHRFLTLVRIPNLFKKTSRHPLPPAGGPTWVRQRLHHQHKITPPYIGSHVQNRPFLPHLLLPAWPSDQSLCPPPCWIWWGKGNPPGWHPGGPWAGCHISTPLVIPWRGDPSSIGG